jgi:MoaA/NifB/PqqE/SkfB family radical SAM enzyme
MILAAIGESSAAAVTFCGGEPLLVREIDKYATILADRGKRTVLNTNGALLRRRIDQGLTLPFDVVGISIDGSTSESHREMRGSGADLTEALSSAELIAQHSGIRLKVATVVSSVNKDDLHRIATLVSALGADVWRIYQYSPRGAQNVGQQRHAITEGEFYQLATWAAEWAHPIPVFPSSHKLSAGCLIVSSEGTVLQPNDGDYTIHGNCLNEPLDSIWEKISDQVVIDSNKRWLSLVGINTRLPSTEYKN